ncbi:hypothetical protein ABI59_11460 [Acidobacteria bacterium Mor1]|nr:hypothetical protein ABI59_11460 [Acidobacteria bacterium Mor1]
MNLGGVLFLLGRLLLALAGTLMIPAVFSYFADGLTHADDFFLAAGIAGGLGFVLQILFRQPRNFSFGRHEAFLLVSAAWITASLVGAIPYLMHHGLSFAADALFESVSGFTTTGASIYSEVESLPRGLLLWRSLTQWLGGMGIIVLGIAILPKLAVGGMELLGAEAPGPMQEKLTPRIAQTAKALWGIYATLTALEFVLLWIAGMSPFDAINHAMTTTATAGFSTNDHSIMGFQNGWIELIVLTFMIMAGANFALHFQLLRGRPRPLFTDPEFRLYLGILGGATVLLAANLMLHRGEGLLDALRLGAFQATTMVTTTGYATADYDQWPNFARALLFMLVFVGGCAGSTTGSVKVVRSLIVIKKLGVDLKKLLQPHAVLPVRVGNRSIPEDVVTSVTTFMLLFLGLFAAGGLTLGFLGVDLLTAFSASASCVANVGPGLAGVGPATNYGHFPAAVKVVLSGLMITGRLELYTILVLLFIRWRR